MLYVQKTYVICTGNICDQYRKRMLYVQETYVISTENVCYMYSNNLKANKKVKPLSFD
jgi:hypothetical protein